MWREMANKKEDDKEDEGHDTTQKSSSNPKDA